MSFEEASPKARLARSDDLSHRHLPSASEMEPDSYREPDVVVVGAGFAGLYALYRLRMLGFSVRVLEAASGIGGTWYWNRYPGARCDVPSVEYSFSFSEELQREWEWTEKYATQPEILRYLEHVADRFDLYRDIQLGTRVTAASYDEPSARWSIEAEDGSVIRARFVVMATGCLSVPHTPSIAGIGDFAGRVLHTGAWPFEGVEFGGQRVGVIGTGSSGIQCVPLIAEEAVELVVFQRTPSFSVPAKNAPLDAEYKRWLKSNYPQLRERLRASSSATSIERNESSALDATCEERARAYEERWQQGSFAFLGAYGDLMVNKDANETAALFIHDKIKAIVHDPATAARLLPTDYAVGAKRMCVDTHYYETFNRENVTLVDTRESPIEAITAVGVRTHDRTYRLDTIVLATGFDAMTGSLLAMDIRGRSGLELREHWNAGPRTLLGLSVYGFPNLFVVAGPGSPSILSNMVMAIEQHVEWIADCLVHLRTNGLVSIEAKDDAESAWVEHVNDMADQTLFPTANSWYLGANIPGKPRVFMPYVVGLRAYRERCDEVARAGYEGFALDGSERDGVRAPE